MKATSVLRSASALRDGVVQTQPSQHLCQLPSDRFCSLFQATHKKRRGNTVVKRIVSDPLSGLTGKAEEATPTISEVSGERKKATSDLYFVECRTQLIETAGDTTRSVASRQSRTREVTLIYLSFTNCDISIALLGGGVTLEGGKM